MDFCCYASVGNSSQHHCLFSAKTSPSPEFSCWQAEGLFQLDKRNAQHVFLQSAVIKHLAGASVMLLGELCMDSWA